MSTTYLNDDKEIVFLNSKNIAQKTSDIDTIDYNAIPSLSLFNGLSNDVALSAMNVSNDIDALKVEDTWLSSQISSRVVVAYKTSSGYATTNRLSVIELNNDEYNTLASHSELDPKALYVVKDNFIDAKGQVLSNLAAPTVDNHAANKLYVDEVSANTLGMAKTYADSLSTSLSITIPVELAAEIAALSTSLSGTVDARRLKAIQDLSDSISATVVNSHYAVVDNTQFGYNYNEHTLSISLQSITGEPRVLSVDAKAFIENRIIDSMTVITNSDGIRVLRLTWKTGTAESRYVDLPLSELVKVYDEGTGIIITEGDAFTIAVDFDVVARKGDLTTLSGAVDTLKDTTVPGIAETVNTLSTTMHNAITGNIDTLSTELTAYTDSSKFAGKFAGLSGDVSTLSTELNTKFLLSAEAVDAIRSTLLEQINANNSQITANRADIEALQDYADKLSGEATGVIPALSSKVDNAVLNASQARLSAEYLLGANGPIAEIQVAQASIDGRIEGLSTLTQSHTGTLMGHEFNIEKNADNINVLSASAREWDTALSNNLANLLSLSAQSLSDDIRTLSGQLSDEIETLSVNLSTEIKTLSANLSTDLSSKIDDISAITDKKIYFNGLSCTSLSISAYVSQSVFHDMVLNNQLEDNTIYMISSDMTDMYNEKIVNLADPTDEQDAVNYRTLSSTADSLSTQLKDLIVDSLQGINSNSTLADVIIALQTLSATLLN